MPITTVGESFHPGVSSGDQARDIVVNTCHKAVTKHLRSDTTPHPKGVLGRPDKPNAMAGTTKTSYAPAITRNKSYWRPPKLGSVATRCPHNPVHPPTARTSVVLHPASLATGTPRPRPRPCMVGGANGSVGTDLASSNRQANIERRQPWLLLRGAVKGLRTWGRSALQLA
jgi:hypothetical protein